MDEVLVNEKIRVIFCRVCIFVFSRYLPGYLPVADRSLSSVSLPYQYLDVLDMRETISPTRGTVIPS